MFKFNKRWLGGKAASIEFIHFESGRFCFCCSFGISHVIMAVVAGSHVS